MTRLKNFYENLRGFTTFNELTHDGHFHAVPSDWFVIITDVEGSTQAITAGRYRDVNTVGAASIVASQNVLGDCEFPYVFGGDGTTLLVSAEQRDEVIAELVKLKALAVGQFNLVLRVGVVGVAELYQEGVRLEVAKFEIAHGRCVALFRGGGLTLAEKKIKGDIQRYGTSEGLDAALDLGGLSCRWQDIPSKHGKILPVLVVAKPGASADSEALIYQEVLKAFDRIYGQSIRAANPVNLKGLRYKSVRQCFRDERRYHHSLWTLGFLKRFVEIIFSNLIFKLKLPNIFFNHDDYVDGMAAHSDYRKFDDTLRMVLDCSEKQSQEIQAYLVQRHDEGKLYYGTHESDTSLMTCYVTDVNDGNHIHFVDGGGGGYAMAAIGLKEQHCHPMALEKLKYCR